MQTQIGVVVAVAVLNDDIMTNLPTDPVTVVIARRHVATCDAIAVLHEDTTGVVPIQILVLLAIAIESNVFDHDVRNVISRENREQRCRGGLSHQPKVLSQRTVQLKSVS